MVKNKINCLIFHGLGGSSQENWFLWLRNELMNLGIKTEAPNFPNSENPDLSVWLNHLKNYQINENTILVGHSLGTVLILRLLEQDLNIKAAFLAAAFAHDLGWEVLRNSGFFEKEFNWQKIKNNCQYFEILTSANDPYLSIEDSEVVAQALGVTNQILGKFGHFNLKELPIVSEKIKKYLLI